MILPFIVKPLFIFIISYIYLRLAGKKAVSEMNSFDLLFIIVVSNIMAEPLVTKKPIPAMVYAGIIMATFVAFSYIVLNNKLRWLLITKPTVLIRNGDIDEKGLRKARITTQELISTLRQKGYTNTADVELALMEDMGKVSVIPKSHARPLQPSDIQLQPSPTFIPIPLILNGQIIYHNLKYLEKDQEWLKLQLQAHGLSLDNISDITLGTYTQQGTLAIDTDNPNNNSHTSDPNMYKPGWDN